MPVIQREQFRRNLLEWYLASRRDLPWRNTTEPYHVWVSEIMLQQTRVAAVIPYYQRFIETFPDLSSLAAASGRDLLEAWAGLGYYSRVRNMQKAAREMPGPFPAEFDQIRALPGVGSYTAAAVASIAFGLPHAAVDGNAMRVLTRLTADPSDIASQSTRRALQELAASLIDTGRPGDFNQAMMELGATVCLPANPRCGFCPVREQCQANARGIQGELPVKSRRMKSKRVERTLLIARRGEALLMWQRTPEETKLAGFWELPDSELLPGLPLGAELGRFRHSITDTNYVFRLREARIGRKPNGLVWRRPSDTSPLSTVTRKALAFISC